MIIDVHRHMWAGFERYKNPSAEVANQEQSPLVNYDWQQTTREIVQEMDGAGVDISVLIVADFGDRRGSPIFTIDEENRFLAEAKKMYPDRIIAFYGIDPRRPNAVDKFEKAIKEWDISGLKLHPTVGYFPHDKVCYPFYELCTAYGLPVLIHSGPGFHPRLYSRFTHPFEFDEVATDFPRLGIIMGHASNEWWEDCVTIASSHPNMVVDISEWQTRLRDNPEETVPAIDRMRKVLGIDRIFWGTDFPHMRRFTSLKESVEIFRSLPSLASRYGIKFQESEVEALLGSNAAQFLRLK